MAAGTGEELQMATTFSIRKFRLEILNYLSRRLPLGRGKNNCLTIYILTEISGNKNG